VFGHARQFGCAGLVVRHSDGLAVTGFEGGGDALGRGFFWIIL